MRRLLSILMPALLCCGAAVAGTDGPTSGQCQIPDEFAAPATALAPVRAALQAGGHVDILAVGSATTVGQDIVAQGSSFPYRMARALEVAFPRATFDLTVLGGRGLTAVEMLALMRDALSSRHYPLVLWQTGTVEAVRGLPPDEFLQTLQSGSEAVRAQGGDLILIDPQFSQFLVANTDLTAYEGAFREASTLPDAALFRRFDLMRTWAESGEIDLDHLAKPDRQAALDRLHECLGVALGRFVINGAAVPPS